MGKLNISIKLLVNSGGGLRKNKQFETVSELFCWLRPPLRLTSFCRPPDELSASEDEAVEDWLLGSLARLAAR